MAITNEPYTPAPVPNTGQPDLERFVAEELDRIAALLEAIINEINTQHP